MINSSTTVRERTSFNELLNFFKKQFCRPPMVICLIERAADNLVNFQAVVKKRLSKFELFKCCRIFQQRSETDFVSNQRVIQVLQRIASAAKLTVLFREKKGMPFFCTTRLRHLVLTKSTISTVIVKRSSIQSDIDDSSDTRRE